jgi:tetratricopeptide (TPR) repeat protein
VSEPGGGLENAQALLAHFRGALRSDPAAAFREWFRAQEDLAERGEDAICRALADDLANGLYDLPFSSEDDRARFFHNVAVFFGTPGPAADLSRARELFSAALERFSRNPDSGWEARARHNFATALANLGTTADDLAQSLNLFESALGWRTGEREIARGVTLHHMGVASRRAAELEPAQATAMLERSVRAFEEAIEIRSRLGLSEGHALSLFHLAVSLSALGRPDEARRTFLTAADCFDALGKTASAELARARAEITSVSEGV